MGSANSPADSMPRPDMAAPGSEKARWWAEWCEGCGEESPEGRCECRGWSRMGDMACSAVGEGENSCMERERRDVAER